MTQDLTRWNRAGLSRFRYVDGNAATHLESVRERLQASFQDWSDIAVPPDDDDAAAIERMERQYATPRHELGWEIARTFARACHVLTEHLDAYANEGYLGTATQWDNVRRLVGMLDYHPAPPASASTQLVLQAKEGEHGKLPAGFAVQYVPDDGGEPVVFETLEDIYVDAALNELKLAGHDRSSDVVFGSTLTLAGAGSRLDIGQPVVVEDERDGRTEARIISGVSVDATITTVDLDQPIHRSSGFTKGSTLVHLEPIDRMEPVGPLSGGGTLGKGVHLSDQPTTLRPGHVVHISDGERSTFRRVRKIRGRVVVVDAEVGTLTTKDASVSRAQAVSVRSLARRDNVLVAHVVGDYSRLMGESVADLKTAGGDKSLVEVPVFSAVYEPVAESMPEGGGYTTLKLSDPNNRLKNPQNLWIPPVARDWRVDSFLEPANPLPTDLDTAKPKKTSAGDHVVVVSGKQIAWASAVNVAVDDGKATATISVKKWHSRAGIPYFPAASTVYGHFSAMHRLAGWDTDQREVTGTILKLESLPASLTQDRHLLIEGTGDVAKAKVKEVRRGSGAIVISPALGSGFSVSGTIIRANLVAAGHGEAKPTKVLGSGAGTQRRQTLLLDEDRVALVDDATFPTGVRADITVTVDDRTWTQVPTLNDSKHADSHYVVNMTEEGYMTVGFGDGEHGRLVPLGTNNVRVSYRVGTGSVGNLEAGRLATPVRPHRLIESVSQPLPCTGGNDMESIESMRSNAPSSVLTLERAVSVADYSAMAARQSSVWQARAFALPTGLSRQVSLRVVVVPAGGGELLDLKTSLEEFLTNHGEAGVAIEVTRYKPRIVDVTVQARIDPASFPPDHVVGDIRTALLASFSLKARPLGHDMYLSEVVSVVEGVGGVENSICTLFDGGVPTRRARAAPDEVIHFEGDRSLLSIDWKEYEL